MQEAKGSSNIARQTQRLLTNGMSSLWRRCQRSKSYMVLDKLVLDEIDSEGLWASYYLRRRRGGRLTTEVVQTFPIQNRLQFWFLLRHPRHNLRQSADVWHTKRLTEILPKVLAGFWYGWVLKSHIQKSIVFRIHITRHPSLLYWPRAPWRSKAVRSRVIQVLEDSRVRSGDILSYNALG